MYIKNLGEIEAIAFDIDGTLYPQNSIHWRAIFHYIIHNTASFDTDSLLCIHIIIYRI